MRAYLHDRYAGVIPERRLDRYVRDYVDMGLAPGQVELIKIVNPGARAVLDVGCGFGSFVLASIDAGLHGVGVDIAPFELSYARSRLQREHPGLDASTVYRRARAEELPFPPGSFDVVTLWNVAEHVVDPRQVLAEAIRVTRAHGHVVVVAPNYAAARIEPHYRVPWLPLFPKRLASPYLRLLGRDPGFLLEEVHYCTNAGIRRILRGSGCRLRALVEFKLRALDSIATPWKRSLVGSVGDGRSGKLISRLLRMWSRNALNPSIALVAEVPDT